MTVEPQPTPNPNALKFTVGQDVGGPKTYVSGGDIDDPVASQLLEIDGVTSVFMTADFVTISKLPTADWADITPIAEQVLTTAFGT